METGNGTGDNFFDNLAKGMAEDQAKLNNGQENKPAEEKKAETAPAITSENQLDTLLKGKTTEAPATTATTTEAVEEVPEWKKTQLFESKTPAAIDYKAEYEKLNQSKSALEKQIQSRPEWVKKLEQMSSDPNFNPEAWFRSQVSEDFSKHSAEQLYEKFLDKTGVQGEKREAEVELFANKSLYEKEEMRKKLAAEFSAETKGSGDNIYDQIKAARDADEQAYLADQQILVNAEKELAQIPTLVVGKKIAGFEVTKEGAEKAYQSIMDPNVGRREDGTIDVQTTFYEKFVAQNINAIIDSAVESAKLDWLRDRGNGSTNQTRTAATFTDNDPLATGMKNFLNS